MKNFLKILFAIIFIFGVPLALNFLLFPIKKIPIQDFDIGIGEVEGSEEIIIDPDFRNSLMKLLQVPFELERYDVSIVNSTQDYKPGDCLKSSSYLILAFIEGNPEKYNKPFFKKPGEYELRLGSGDNWKIPFGETGRFTVSPEDHFRIAASFAGECEGEIRKSDLPYEIKYEIYAKQNMPMWFVKLLFIFIFWIIILSSFITVFKFLRSGLLNKNKN